MEAVRKAASEAVDTIRNSPLFRRKFGNRSTEQETPETPRPLHPESDKTPFVQGVYFQVANEHIILMNLACLCAVTHLAILINR